MARGWESKAVAEQMEAEQEQPIQRPAEDRSPEARLQREKLERLRLSRSRTLAQLEQATSPAYRQMLEKALRDLEREIEEGSKGQ